MSSRPLPIKISDINSLERLLNESYQEIYDEQMDLEGKISDINKCGEEEDGNSKSIFLMQFGEIYTRIIEAKGKVSDRKIKLIQVLKEVYKMDQGDKSKGGGIDMKPEDILDIAEKVEAMRKENE